MKIISTLCKNVLFFRQTKYENISDYNSDFFLDRLANLIRNIYIRSIYLKSLTIQSKHVSRVFFVIIKF